MNMEQQNDTTQHLTPAPAAPQTDTDAKAATDARRLPYTAPAVEVISVRTERGYAGSLDDRGNHRW